MALYLPLICKINLQESSRVINVPYEYKVVQLVNDLIQAQGLEYETNQPLRYVLQRQKNGEILSPHLTFSQSKLLYGETVCLKQISARRATSTTDFIYQYNADILGQAEQPNTIEGELPVYLSQVRLLKAAGDYEQAATILLNRWFERFARRKQSTFSFRSPTASNQASQAHPEEELKFLRGEIIGVFTSLVEEQLEATYFEELYNLLRDEVTKAYFNHQSDQRDYVVELLLAGSYTLAQRQKYQNARDFAVLAMQLEQDNELAALLEELAHKYLNIQATSDREEQLELARSIAAVDSNYGNVAADLAALDEQKSPTQSGPNNLTLALRPPEIRSVIQAAGLPKALPKSAPVKEARTGRPLSQKIYFGVALIVLISLFLLFMFWVAMS